jgi:hypothetical protein
MVMLATSQVTLCVLDRIALMLLIMGLEGTRLHYDVATNLKHIRGTSTIQDVANAVILTSVNGTKSVIQQADTDVCFGTSSPPRAIVVEFR